MKTSRKMIQKLEERVKSVEQELDSEQRRHSEAQKNLRKTERRIKELSFQVRLVKAYHSSRSSPSRYCSWKLITRQGALLSRMARGSLSLVKQTVVELLKIHAISILFS